MLSNKYSKQKVSMACIRAFISVCLAKHFRSHFSSGCNHFDVSKGMKKENFIIKISAMN